MEFPKLPKYDPQVIDQEILDSIAKWNEKKECRDSFRFWFSVAIMTVGVILAAYGIYRTHKSSNIAAQLQQQSVSIEKSSIDLSALDHRVTSLESTLVKISKKIAMLDVEKTYKLNPQKAVTQK